MEFGEALKKPQISLHYDAKLLKASWKTTVCEFPAMFKIPM